MTWSLLARGGQSSGSALLGVEIYDSRIVVSESGNINQVITLLTIISIQLCTMGKIICIIAFIYSVSFFLISKSAHKIILEFRAS